MPHNDDNHQNQRENATSPYERKFPKFIQLLARSKEDLLIVHHPEVLGDTFAEVIESLNRLADAKKSLLILPTSERAPRKSASQ